MEIYDYIGFVGLGFMITAGCVIFTINLKNGMMFGWPTAKKLLKPFNPNERKVALASLFSFILGVVFVVIALLVRDFF